MKQKIKKVKLAILVEDKNETYQISLTEDEKVKIIELLEFLHNGEIKVFKVEGIKFINKRK